MRYSICLAHGDDCTDPDSCPNAVELDDLEDHGPGCDGPLNCVCGIV